VISQGYAAATLPGPNTFHAELTGPYAPRALPDISVAASGQQCTMTPSPISAYAPPDRPATLVLTTPDGAAVSLAVCAYSADTCTSGQPRIYSGSTHVTLGHGCWCSASPNLSLPVVLVWDFGPPCALQVWVPACVGPTFSGTVPARTLLRLCGVSVDIPAPCVNPASQFIPIVLPGTPFCRWIDLAAWDFPLFSQPTTCSPLFWQSGFVPPFSDVGGTCQADSASSFVWPGGGYFTITS
jgi:hypothetical protein